MRFSFVVIAVLLVSGAMALATFPRMAGGSWSLGVDDIVFLVAASTTVIGSAILAWRDVYAFAMLAALLGGFALVGVALALWVGGPMTWGLMAFTIGAVAVAAAGAGYVAYNQLSKPAVPDVLLEHFDRGHVYETGGVQLVPVAPSTLPEDTIAPFELYLQNCMDVSREVTVALDDLPLVGSGGHVQWRGPASILLEPAEVKLVSVPFCAAHLNAGRQTIYLHVRAKGRRGKRLRPRRAPNAASALARWQIVLIVLLALPLFTIVVWGRGGLRVVVQFTAGSRLRHASELPEPSEERLWARSPL